ncbi:ovocalyxin-32-like [Paroedura picta]|uniref:ovocalyxin-32-like n=1 Tax=Paroedura picta TaxID=143630 RepID=UPI0040577E9E
MQPSKAARRGSLLLVLAAALLVPLLADQKPWRVPALSHRLVLDASSPRVQRAAQTAVNYYNFVFSGPGAMRAAGLVKKAHVKFVPGVGRKYFLQFTMKDLETQDYVSTCHASVFYVETKPKPAIEISCFPEENKSERLMEKALLYSRLKEKEPPVDLLEILGAYGSSFVAWEKSSEDLSYTLTQIKSAHVWKRADDTPEFYYHVLLGDQWEKSILSCHMRVSWGPLSVKYSCSLEDDSSESTDGSGEESGSTNEVFYEAENNF